MDEGEALTALLTAVEDLHNIRNEMHNCLKQARRASNVCPVQEYLSVSI